MLFSLQLQCCDPGRGSKAGPSRGARLKRALIFDPQLVICALLLGGSKRKGCPGHDIIYVHWCVTASILELGCDNVIQFFPLIISWVQFLDRMARCTLEVKVFRLTLIQCDQLESEQKPSLRPTYFLTFQLSNSGCITGSGSERHFASLLRHGAYLPYSTAAYDWFFRQRNIYEQYYRPY